MKYNGIIENKLRIIEEKLADIRSWNIETFEQFQNSSMLQNATERALQVAVEVMIDVSERILALEKQAPAKTASENIANLKKLGVISDDAGYADMVRFRNFLVHRYEKIDLEIVYTIVRHKLPLFEQFVEQVRVSG